MKLRVVLVTLLIVAGGVSSVLGAESTRYIVGLNLGADVGSMGEGVTAMSARIEASGGVIDHRFPSIGAVAVQLTDQQVAELSASPDVKYVVPDGIVATPGWWASRGSPLQAPRESDHISSQATPIEFYTWNVKRINAPLMHRVQPRNLMAGIAVGMLGIFVAGGILRRRCFLNTSASKSLLLGLVMTSGLLLASGCTAVSVFPHAGVMGESVTVAILDTGVEIDHPDLKANVLGGIDLVNRDLIPMDDNGHGTGVAGVLAAEENGSGVIGVAPRVKMWAIKTLRFDEQGTIADVIAGIEWAMEKDVDIIGMSLGTDEDNRAMHDAMQAAAQAGIMLVAAAGNNGARVLYPAAYPEVIAVGSTDEQDQPAWFSNQGEEVELVAPGTNILTTNIGKGYTFRDGTSFSVPHVIGVGAMLISTGARDAREVRNRLTSTAENLGLVVTAQGYGMVNAERAVLDTTGP